MIDEQKIMVNKAEQNMRKQTEKVKNIRKSTKKNWFDKRSGESIRKDENRKNQASIDKGNANRS